MCNSFCKFAKKLSLADGNSFSVGRVLVLFNMKRLFSLAFLLLVMALTAIASQPQSPVRWRTIIKQTGPDCGTVTFRALVGEGWHLYGTILPEDGPKPTTFDLSESTGVVFDGVPSPKRDAVKAVDELFGAEMEWWDANIDFSVNFHVTDAENAFLKAQISYMACNGVTCRPPTTENIATSIRLKSEK